MKNKFLWFLAFLPTIVSIYLLQFMNHKIPAHYDIYGNVDRWGSKYEIFILPIFIILATYFWVLLLNFLNKKYNATEDEKVKIELKNNSKFVSICAVSSIIIFNVIHFYFLYTSLNTIIDLKNILQINLIINIAVGITLIIIGNYLPKCRRNFIIGVRNKWSLKNDLLWSKSNRFGGICFIISGVIIIIQSFLIEGILSTVVMLIILILSGIVSYVYSYKFYKEN